MSVSHASVHPVQDPPTVGGANAPRARTKDMEGMPATLGGLVLRSCQLLFAAISLAIMATTSDFSSVTAFWCVLHWTFYCNVKVSRINEFPLTVDSILAQQYLCHLTNCCRSF